MKPPQAENRAMEILHFSSNRAPTVLTDTAQIPEDGLVWVDFIRDEAQHWECWAEPLIGVPIESQHVEDSHNPTHPSFFDGTPDYDMLIFQGLGPRDDPFPLETRTAAFFLFDRVLITIRAPDNVSIGATRKKLLDGRLKSPDSVLKIAHAILDTMVDRFLKVREPLDKYFTELQDELLDPSNKTDDWRTLLAGRRVARKLEWLSENQMEVLDGWRRGTRADWSAGEEVLVRDLREHVDRVLDHARDQERDIEAAVQLHFSSVTHQTNKIMQTLTVLSAIFFPLTLIVGIYGMNFENMPELHWRYGYFMALGLLAFIGGGLMYIFKRRGFF
jgi:magnesium transporter